MVGFIYVWRTYCCLNLGTSVFRFAQYAKAYLGLNRAFILATCMRRFAASLIVLVLMIIFPLLAANAYERSQISCPALWRSVAIDKLRMFSGLSTSYCNLKH